MNSAFRKKRRYHRAETVTPSPAEPVRVLLVDDQRLFVDAVGALLELDHRVEVVGVAQNADEALALAAGTTVEVALVDLVLPGQDGGTLARELQSVQPEVRIVLVSGRPEAELRAEAAEAGAAAYLRKGSLGGEIVDVILEVAGA